QLHPEAIERPSLNYGSRLETAPFFVADQVEWHRCDAAFGPAICLEWKASDVKRWNTRFAGERMNGVALVVSGTVISIVHVHGPLANPLAISQMDGKEDQAALEAFLRAHSDGK